MKCPIDGETLVISDRNGIEIDYCPTCRGVWLDRGELDKIIERSAAAAPVPQQEYESFGRKSKKDKKKEGLGGMLGDIFDF
jgi:Zn-finger nucleic acid-binding protein